MPAYPIPSWLRPPPDPGEEYIQAVHAGASIAGQQAQLQAQAAQAQQQHEMEKQRLEISKQYSQLQMGLQQQQLKQQGQLIQARTQQAARQFQAQQLFQQTRQQGVDSGLSEEEATRRAVMAAGPGLGTNVAQFYKDLLPPTAEQVKRTPGGEEYIVGGSRPIHTFGRAALPGSMTQQQNAQVRSIEAEIRRIDKAEIPIAVAKKAQQEGETMEETINRLKQAQIDEKQAQIDAILGGQAPPPPGAAPQAPPPAAPGTNAPPIKIISIRPKEAKPVSDEERAKGIAEAMSQWKGFGG